MGFSDAGSDFKLNLSSTKKESTPIQSLTLDKRRPINCLSLKIPQKLGNNNQESQWFKQDNSILIQNNEVDEKTQLKEASNSLETRDTSIFSIANIM